jgi:hypothetical protein
MKRARSEEHLYTGNYEVDILKNQEVHNLHLHADKMRDHNHIISLT